MMEDECVTHSLGNDKETKVFRNLAGTTSSLIQEQIIGGMTYAIRGKTIERYRDEICM